MVHAADADSIHVRLRPTATDCPICHINLSNKLESGPKPQRSCAHCVHSRCLGEWWDRQALDHGKPSDCPTCATPHGPFASWTGGVLLSVPLELSETATPRMALLNNAMDGPIVQASVDAAERYGDVCELNSLRATLAGTLRLVDAVKTERDEFALVAGGGLTIRDWVESLDGTMQFFTRWRASTAITALSRGWWEGGVKQCAWRLVVLRPHDARCSLAQWEIARNCMLIPSGLPCRLPWVVGSDSPGLASADVRPDRVLLY